MKRTLIRHLSLAGLALSIATGCSQSYISGGAAPRAPTDGGGDGGAPNGNLGGTGGGGTGGSGGGVPGPAGPGVPPVPVLDEPFWVHPTSLLDTRSMDGNDSDSGSVAAGANGDALIGVEYGSRLFLSERVGGVWNFPVRFVTQPHNPAGGSMFTPRSAIHSNGNAIVVWVQRDNGTDRVYACSRQNGVWTDPANHADHLSPNSTEGALAPGVVIDPAGDGIVVWEQYVGGNGRIFKSEVHNGVWTNPSSDGDGISAGATHAQDVALAVGPDGHVIVAWAQWGTSNYSIFKSERINGAWTHPANLAAGISPNGSHAFAPKIAFDGIGDAVLTWIQGDGSNEQVFVSQYRSGVWQHPTGLSDNISPDGTNAHAVCAAMSANRQAVIVWSQDVAPSQSRLFKSVYGNASWTHPAGLNDHFSVGDHVNEFTVGMDSIGNVIVPYTAADASLNWATYKSERRYSSWLHPGSLADHISPTGTVATLPWIAVDGDDAVIVIWRQSDGTFQKTYMSEYR